MQYSFQDWNKQSGTIPVTWTDRDYITGTKWQDHPNHGGYITDDYNLSVYDSLVGVLIPDVIHPKFFTVAKYFDLKNLVVDLSKYTPGMLLPWHVDDYPTYSKNMGIQNLDNIVRIIVFLHDSRAGHQLWIEDNFCTGPAGSWFSWTGQTKHMAANLGETDRYVIQLTGHI